MSARSGAARAVISLIQLYRHTISPLRLPTCRFTPTCSQYAVDALGEFGFFRGSWLALVRLLKCGPWHSGGWDPIPDSHIHRDRDRDRDSSNDDVADHRKHPLHQGKSQTSVF